MKISINEALGWKKTLQQRHGELTQMRNENSRNEISYRGDKETEKRPLYDVKQLDTLVTGLAREIRHVDMAIKRANAKTILENYEQDEKVLGELT